MADASLPPSSPPASSSNTTTPTGDQSCFGPDCAEPTLFIVTLVLLSLLCVCANVYCWRRRGIGVCGILSLFPGRLAGETLAMLQVDNNEVRLQPPRRLYVSYRKTVRRIQISK